MDTGTEGDRLVVYPSRVKMFFVLLGAIAFVVLGFWIASPEVASRVAPWKVLVASYVGVPFFGTCGLYASYRLVRHRPSIEIDATGITDNASAVAVGHLSWDEIDYVRPYECSGQSMLGIFPKDLGALLARQNAWRRTMMKLGLGMGGAPVNIPQTTLPMTVEELAEILRTRHGVRSQADGQEGPAAEPHS